MKFRNLIPALSLCAALSPAMAAESGREPPEVLASLDPIFEKLMSDNHVPGLVFGVVADGKLAYVRAFGVQDTSTNTAVTPDTVFRIASMSKNFSALAALKLRDAGKLAFDAPAERYIPELAKLRYPTSDSPKITVRDLLSHGAGFVTDDPWGDRQLDMSESDFSKFIVSGIPFSRAPGMAYEYSNFGYALVGRLITNISRRNYADYIEAQFLQPLGMRATTYDIAKIPRERRATGYRWEKESWREEPALGPGPFGAMGGLATSANDYAHYVSWVLSAWPPRDGAEDPILRRSSVREIARPQNFATLVPAADPAGCARSAAYGLGENSQNDCVLGFHFGHSGGLPGYGSNVLFIPGRNLAVFAFANRTYAPASRAVREAANQLANSGRFPVRAPSPSPALQSMLSVSQVIYDNADVARFPEALAMNFLMDRSAELRNAEIAALKVKYGECRIAPPITTDSALSGSFDFSCERGKLKIELILAPTRPDMIQKLEFVPEKSGH
jgi:serine-type D-Ala-D-Ala carboxypeptidase/endopeptidase